MPCYSGEDSPRIVYKDNPEDKRAISELFDQAKKLEAGLCALINELEKRDIAKEVIGAASENGNIDLFEFWKRHSKKDRDRLSDELKRFSEHEKEILRDLLSK